jgi:hypothetical protein
MWTRPKKEYQWKPERSAMELAKAWFRQSEPSPPEELSQLLHSSERLTTLKLLRGIPERVTSLPESGEGRNHDLWLLGWTQQEQVTICIEAKTDEPFGNVTVAEYRRSANKRREAGEATRVPERITKLLSLVPAGDNRWDNVRYQLLAAICGTAIQAQRDGSALAVFVVHEFHTRKTTTDKISANAKDFNAFMAAITGSQGSIVAGMLYGPVSVGGVNCLIGKTITAGKNWTPERP